MVTKTLSHNGYYEEFIQWIHSKADDMLSLSNTGL